MTQIMTEKQKKQKLRPLMRVGLAFGILGGTVAGGAAFDVSTAQAAEAYTETMYQCRKVSDYYYDCWTFRNYNWFEEAIGLDDKWYWKRI